MSCPSTPGPSPERAEEYADAQRRALFVEPHLGFFLFDVDPQLYVTRYLRAWALETRLTAHLTARFNEDWWRNPASGRWLQGLFARGGTEDAEALATAFGKRTDAPRGGCPPRGSAQPVSAVPRTAGGLLLAQRADDLVLRRAGGVLHLGLVAGRLRRPVRSRMAFISCISMRSSSSPELLVAARGRGAAHSCWRRRPSVPHASTFSSSDVRVCTFSSAALTSLAVTVVLLPDLALHLSAPLLVGT